MLFATNTSVIEFPMSPHCNRCFGYMAVALGLDYWVVPEVTAFYHLSYEMDSSKAAAVVRTLRRVLEHRNLTHLIQRAGHDDAEL